VERRREREERRYEVRIDGTRGEIRIIQRRGVALSIRKGAGETHLGNQLRDQHHQQQDRFWVTGDSDSHVFMIPKAIQQQTTIINVFLNPPFLLADVPVSHPPCLRTLRRQTRRLQSPPKMAMPPPLSPSTSACAPILLR